MGRPRTKLTGLPSYCYRKAGTGSLYMKQPSAGGLTNVYYGQDMERMLADWRAVWGAKATGERPVLMGGLFDAYLVDIAKRRMAGDIGATTAADYERCVASLRPVWGQVRVLDVDAPGLYAWQEVRKDGSRVRCNRERTTLSECFKLAIRLGVTRTNPVLHLKPLKERPRDRYVSDAEFASVYAHAPTIVQAAMILAAITGLRQGDILRLRRADFGAEGLTVKTRKTGQPMLYAWTDGLKRAVLVAVGARDFVPLILLATANGKPYSSTGFQTAWQRTMSAAQKATPSLSRFTFNDLRAKAGSESHDWKLLGHLDQRTFERVYNRLPRAVTPNR